MELYDALRLFPFLRLSLRTLPGRGAAVKSG